MPRGGCATGRGPARRRLVGGRTCGRLRQRPFGRQLGCAALTEHLLPFLPQLALSALGLFGLGLQPVKERAEIEAPPARLLQLLASGYDLRHVGEDIGNGGLGGGFRDHLAVIRRGAEEQRIEGDRGDRRKLQRRREILRLDLRPLRHADLVQHQLRRGVVRTGLPQEIDDRLGVPEIGEVGRRGDHHLIGRDQRLARPGRPDMRHVEHHGGHVRLHDLEHLVEGVLAEIVGLVEGGRRGEKAEMVLAFGEQAVEQNLVQPVGAEHGVGDALRGVEIEIEPGRAEGQIEVGEDHVGAEEARHRPGDVVGDGGGADAALGADEGVGLPELLGPGFAIDAGDRGDDGHHARPARPDIRRRRASAARDRAARRSNGRSP